MGADISQYSGTSHHPYTDGMIERYNNALPAVDMSNDKFVPFNG